MGGKKNNQKTGLLLSCWVLLALLLVIFFFVKKDAIFSNLKQTNFFERVTGSTPEFIENYQEPQKPSGNGLLDVEVTPGPAETGSSAEESLAPSSQEEKTPEILVEKQEEPETQKPPVEEKKPEPKSEKPVKKSKVNLCFLSISGDGTVARKIITREIEKSDAPLTNSIKALLDGPQKTEKGCKSLIPEGTRLLGASVKNGIATLNFSEEFEYNNIGAEGYRAQLMQIVFTATEFSTVDSVQFLIEGQRKEYIGSGEDLWMWIGSPYSRSNF